MSRLRPFAALRLLGLTLALALGGLGSQAAASPSAFLENAASFSLGLAPGGGPAAGIGAELVLPVPFIDASLGLEALAAPDAWTTRLVLSTLLLPALGTTPPLAVGVGADLAYGSAGLAAHLGPLVGTDLLFTLDLPMTASFYLAPGYAAGGLSLAWAAELRYYFDAALPWAVELESSNLQLLSLGLRVLF